MPTDRPAPAPDLLARAARIRLACFDVDGTLTDGRLYLSDDGRETKAFHVHDGLGISLLRRAGVTDLIHVADGGVADLEREGIVLVREES